MSLKKERRLTIQQCRNCKRWKKKLCGSLIPECMDYEPIKKLELDWLN